MIGCLIALYDVFSFYFSFVWYFCRFISSTSGWALTVDEISVVISDIIYLHRITFNKSTIVGFVVLLLFVGTVRARARAHDSTVSVFASTAWTTSNDSDNVSLHSLPFRSLFFCSFFVLFLVAIGLWPVSVSGQSTLFHQRITLPISLTQSTIIDFHHAWITSSYSCYFFLFLLFVVSVIFIILMARSNLYLRCVLSYFICFIEMVEKEKEKNKK